MGGKGGRKSDGNYKPKAGRDWGKRIIKGVQGQRKNGRSNGASDAPARKKPDFDIHRHPPVEINYFYHWLDVRTYYNESDPDILRLTFYRSENSRHGEPLLEFNFKPLPQIYEDADNSRYNQLTLEEFGELMGELRTNDVFWEHFPSLSGNGEDTHQAIFGLGWCNLRRTDESLLEWLFETRCEQSPYDVLDLRNPNTDLQGALKGCFESLLETRPYLFKPDPGYQKNIFRWAEGFGGDPRKIDRMDVDRPKVILL